MSEKAVKQQNALWENIKVIVQALVLAMIIRTVLFQPFTIPSGSMMPTLLVGDYIFVNKFAYGYSKYSLPFSPDLFSGRILGSEPKRGDVVVFRFPPNPDVDYIKRVIGLPNDRIQVKNDILYINGQAVPREPHGTFSSDYSQEPGDNIPVYSERLSDTGKVYDTLDLSPTSRGDNTQEYVVPPGHYFMMGDNRNNSYDSRYWGFVPRENIIGTPVLIYMSIDAPEEVWEPGHVGERFGTYLSAIIHPGEVRWKRLFHIF